MDSTHSTTPGNERPARVLLLAGEGASTWVVATALVKQFEDVAIVLESPRPTSKVFRSRLRNFGYWRGSGQIMFRLLVPFLSFLRRRRLRELRHQMQISVDANYENLHRVSSVNSPETQRIIADYSPAVVVVNGTRIIKEKVLRCAPVFINMHAGITPAYRGVHGGYWAMVCGDESRFGTTVHFVDPGVDTGDVIDRAYDTPTPRDGFVTYPLLQLQAGLPHLIAAVAALIRGDDPRQKAAEDDCEPTSQQWYHPTIWEYASNGFRKGIW